MYILISGGNVTFSDALLLRYPEATAVMDGDKMIVSNIWREDLIKLVGDNIIWSEAQPFDSFSIIFTNNEASVDTLSNLLVRYVNFHDGDYTVNIPKYITNIDKLRDPLALGIRPNYYGSIQNYVDGTMTLDELSSAVEEAYLYVLPNANIDTPSISTILGSIDKLDMGSFLMSNATVMEIWNTVKNNSELTGSGIKTYGADTSSIELLFNESDSVFTISKLCTGKDENISELIQIFLPTITTATQCLLKHLTADELQQSKIVNITTDFGASCRITRTVDGEAYNYIFTTGETTDAGLIGELIGDIYLRHTIPTYSMNKHFSVVKDNLTEYVTGYFSESLQFSTDIGSQMIVSAKQYASANTGIGLISSKMIFPILLQTGNSIVPTELHEGVTTAYATGYVEQFFNIPTLVETGNYAYDNTGETGSSLGLFNGVLKCKSPSIESVLIAKGTWLMGKINKIYTNNRYDGAGIANVFNQGFRNIIVGDAVEIVGGKVLTNTWAVSAPMGIEEMPTSAVIDMMRGGITDFDTIGYAHEVPASLEKLPIQVDTVSDGLLLMCSFSREIMGGYFLSGVDRAKFLPNIVDGIDLSIRVEQNFRYSLGRILVNGISITDELNMCPLLASDRPLSVSSDYSIRDEDIALMQSIVDSLRDGVKRSFRYGIPTSDIAVDENSFAYIIMVSAYNALFNDTDTLARYDKLVSIAQGNETLCAQKRLFSGGAISPLLDINISTTGVTTFVDAAIMESYLLTNFSRGLSLSPTTLNILSPTTTELMTNVDEITVLYTIPTSTVDFNMKSFNLKTGVLSTKSIVGGVDTSTSIGGYSTSNVPVGNKESIVVVENQDSYVVYTPTANADGSVTIAYQAFDKDGNDITSQFNTLSIGDNFLHKEVL